MDIFKMKTTKIEKLNLRHMKQQFKSNTTDHESNKTINNDKVEKMKTNNKKNAKQSKEEQGCN